jgi:VNT family MFS transporter (synaptic vesicle glycoprotein 2)
LKLPEKKSLIKIGKQESIESRIKNLPHFYLNLRRLAIAIKASRSINNVFNLGSELIAGKMENDLEAKECEEEISFDEALNRLGFGKFNYCLIILCGVILSCVFFETMGISYALPVAECDLGLTSKQQYGIINGVSFGGITLRFDKKNSMQNYDNKTRYSSSHLWGYVADEHGRKKIILPTLIISFIFTIFSSLTNSFWLFAVYRFFNGFL